MYCGSTPEPFHIPHPLFGSIFHPFFEEKIYRNGKMSQIFLFSKKFTQLKQQHNIYSYHSILKDSAKAKASYLKKFFRFSKILPLF